MPKSQGVGMACHLPICGSVYLQADVLPHISRLSRLFQKENVNFLALKVQVPVTMACLRAIKDAGDHQPPGSFLSSSMQTWTTLRTWGLQYCP
ncbi:hypothetical protein KUCAC02_002485 [Chaenocephalus aceratus]|uniref:Uncharacterized protein n=1 Tax=Chaenocephalus aceratus TaxID=36190 RepID=A0ACB9XVF3_CHAAC|nr:hypothetical protein KUCAC02_002485 [Chaenocephalus aceratus]